MTHWHWIRPYWLWTILPLILLAIGLARQQSSTLSWASIAEAHLIEPLLIKRGRSARGLKIVTLMLGLLAMIIALAGPSWTQNPIPTYKHRQARMILLDLSPAMLAQDKSPDRLSRAKFKIHDLLAQKDVGQFGLMVYTAEPFVLSPLTDDAQTIDALLSRSANENPSLKAYSFKLEALDVEKKLKFQSLLPMVNVKANLLNSGYNVINGVDGNFLQNNYKWGIDVKLPLLFREGRGDYNKSKLKIQETNLEFNAKKWEIENKIRNYFSEANLLQQQIRSVQQVYNGYLVLFKAENLKFYNGESSLFLLNSRESKLIETAEKLVNLRVKYFKAKYAAEWSAGLLK